MNRRDLLESGAAAALLAFVPASAAAANASVPWSRLKRSLDGELLTLESPFRSCTSASACSSLFADLKNPYYIGDNPALTQTLGWADAWTSSTSAHAVAARHAGDVATAVRFAREHNLKLVVKGGGHSYLGTSNAPDSFLVWTRRMNDVHVGSDRVTMGSGTIWAHAYDAVTTKAGRYVQGGGCCTVGVAGLVQSGGFGSFSKRYGTAASHLLEAEIVTADGSVRTVNASRDPELFWALKGGGGGSFGVVTRVTLALHDLTDYHGACVARISASSDDAYRALVKAFIEFYRDSLMNANWGESVSFEPGNRLAINMVSSGLSTAQIQAVWKPFFDAIAAAPARFTLESKPIMAAAPAQHWWDSAFWDNYFPSAVRLDPRPGRGNDWWWAGDGDQVGWYLYAYDSLWLSQTLLQEPATLVDAIFRATRHAGFALHFNKGLAGAPKAAIDAARDTAMNPSVLDAFALAIAGDGEQGFYPGLPGRKPDMQKARTVRVRVADAMSALRGVAPGGGSYLSESNFFDRDFRAAYWGSNYERLRSAKRRYDPHGFFAVHNGVTPE